MTSTFTFTGRLLDDSKQPLKGRVLTLHAYPAVRSDGTADETYVDTPPLITNDDGYICRRVNGVAASTPGVPLLAGPGQQYSIRTTSGNLRSPLRFDAPTTGTLDLSDITPAAPTPPATWQTWLAAIDVRLTALEAHPGGGGSGTITSVNGNTGPTVVLTAASVGARPDTYVPTWSEVTSKPSFATVATTGAYADLSGKPTIPSIVGLATTGDVTTAQAAAVATAGTDATTKANAAQAAAVQRANHTGTQSASTVTGLATVATSGLKADVGLGNVDNTSDANKPVSTAQAAAAATKQALQQVAATVSASGAAVANKHNPTDATAAARTISLPTGQAEGTQVSVEKVDSSTNTVSITGNIRGVAASTIPLSYLSESLMLRADAAESWWPISGHRTKTTLDAAYFAKAAPTPAGVRTRQFDPLSNIYGSPTARATSRRALGFALGSAKTSLVNIAIAGDSFSQGHKAGVVGTDDWATNLKGLLKAAGYPVTGGWVHAATGNATSGDARWTFGGTWSRSDTTANYAYCTGAAGATATFTSDDTGTIQDIAAFSTAASCTYTVDGGSAVTWNLTANQINVLTLTGLSAGTHTVTITRTQGSGTLYVVAARCRNATGLSISNGAIFGSHTADWVPTAKNTAGTAGADISWLNPYKIMQTLAGAAPKLVLLCLGGNDSQHAGYTLAGMKTNLAAIVAAYQAAGTTVVQRVYTYPSTLGIAAAAAGSPMATGTSWDAFISAMYDVSDTYDTALIDHSTVLGDSNTLEAAGMAYSDHLHLLTPGQAAVARADFRALQAV